MKVRRTNGLKTPLHKSTRGSLYVSIKCNTTCSIWLRSPCTAHSWKPGACQGKTALLCLLPELPGLPEWVWARQTFSPIAAMTGLTWQSPTTRHFCITRTLHIFPGKKPEPSHSPPSAIVPPVAQCSQKFSLLLRSVAGFSFEGAGEGGGEEAEVTEAKTQSLRQ